VSGLDEGASVAERLARLRRSIAQAATACGRQPAEITLVGVSKRQRAEKLVAAVRAGITDLGESFAQEARDKLPRVLQELAAIGLSRPRLHFVGGLQTNKARLVAPLFDVVHSVDRAALASELDQRSGSAGRVLDVLLQVNISGETQKRGVAPEAAGDLLGACANLGSLRVVGLMGLPADTDAELRRPAFARLRGLRDTLARESGLPLPELSMGMTDDYRQAIAEGATIVRIGTALFGPRE
jgi:pyridoxal phosphate enzyme (YggS family)